MDFKAFLTGFCCCDEGIPEEFPRCSKFEGILRAFLKVLISKGVLKIFWASVEFQKWSALLKVSWGLFGFLKL